jgi:hypothetical protein
MRPLFIAVPIPPPLTWRLLVDPADVPDGYVIIGSFAGRRRSSVPAQPLSSEPHTLCADCPLRAQPQLPSEVAP